MVMRHKNPFLSYVHFLQPIITNFSFLSTLGNREGALYLDMPKNSK
jgi:hypothetical protein